MWQKHKFEKEKIYQAQIGKRRFWLAKIQKIWHIATSDELECSLSDGFSEVQKLPDDVTWNWHVADKHHEIFIAPAMPDLPLVIKPEKSFTILPGIEVEIYIAIPLWIQFYASSVKAENIILDIPAYELSSTWFGAPDSGELAYSHPGNILFSTDKDSVSCIEALCPIKIKNDSGSILEFERLSVHANQLNIYSGQMGFFTNEVRVRFKGEDQKSDVQIGKGSPSIAQGYKQFSGARTTLNSNLLEKSFFFIKSFTQY